MLEVIHKVEEGRKRSWLERKGGLWHGLILKSSTCPRGTMNLGDPFRVVPSWGNVYRPSYPDMDQILEEGSHRTRAWCWVCWVRCLSLADITPWESWWNKSLNSWRGLWVLGHNISQIHIPRYTLLSKRQIYGRILVYHDIANICIKQSWNWYSDTLKFSGSLHYNRNFTWECDSDSLRCIVVGVTEEVGCSLDNPL